MKTIINFFYVFFLFGMVAVPFYAVLLFIPVCFGIPGAVIYAGLLIGGAVGFAQLLSDPKMKLFKGVK